MVTNGLDGGMQQNLLGPKKLSFQKITGQSIPTWSLRGVHFSRARDLQTPVRHPKVVAPTSRSTAFIIFFEFGEMTLTNLKKYANVSEILAFWTLESSDLRPNNINKYLFFSFKRLQLM